MGNYNKILFMTLMEGLGLKYILPPSMTSDTVILGTKYCHELACQPLRTSLGDQIKAVRQGANAIMMSAGKDACRYQYYWSTQKKTLREIFGKDIYFFVIKHWDVARSVKDFVREMELPVSETDVNILLARINLKIDIYDAMSIIYQTIRIFNQKESKKLFDEYLLKLQNTNGLSDLNKLFTQITERFMALPKEDLSVPKLKIMLIGSVYELLEPIANNFIEDMLASMNAAAIPMLNYHALAPFMFLDNPAGEFCRGFRPSNSEINNSLNSLMSSPSILRNFGFGGFGAYNVGCAANAKQLGYHGVIHIYPFFCMPEIIAKPFMRDICSNQGIPLLSIGTEESNANIGFRTKIEAFIDLIKWQKERKP